MGMEWFISEGFAVTHSQDGAFLTDFEAMDFNVNLRLIHDSPSSISGLPLPFVSE